ncbi:GlsB/YeaQ/YmgE family stress response membrane protein [Dactylosporangium sp. NBC_01737]|uniref:GlsB/YeaQ/YmgE family stress response membrane protein n=1 Tax=Dactylosporangium sp. NBC_01737 TaxID=2975959 RepID=UPI002E137848|nr:GlsB/YeaQ/YmgE family stress response membrane protein [Dactylosporangium sp. NBC_01737]
MTAIPIGLLIGVLGRLVLPGRQSIGLFITFLIGVGAALLGTLVAELVNLDDDALVKVWKIQWSWWELGIQVLFSAIGIGLANTLTYTRLASGNPKPRKRTTRRRKKAED